MTRMSSKSAITPIGVLCFANNLWEPKPPAEGKPPRHSAILLFDQLAVETQAYKDLQQLILAAVTDKFGAAKAQDAAFVSSLRSPLRDASEKDYAGFDKGVKFISPWSEPKPTIIDVKGNEFKAPDAEVWSGQLARASVRAFAYDNSGNRGVAFGLEHVQIVKTDMERMDGRRSAEQAFGDVIGAQDEQMRALGIDPSAAGASSGDDHSSLF